MPLDRRDTKDSVRPVVSTILPVFEDPKRLTEAVQSVLDQTYRPIEILIVDDGSTDETPEVARRLANEHPEVVHAIRRPNGGAGMARNTGLLNARGEFIQYLDSDDLLMSCKFEVQVRALRDHPEAGVCYGLTLRQQVDGQDAIPWARTNEEIGQIFPDFLMKRGWDTNSPLWRRSVCDFVGLWRDFRVMEDWEHDLRVGLLGVQVIRVPEHVATVRDHWNGRASGMETGFTREITRGFFQAHKSIWQKMVSLGKTDWSYLKSFSRKMFWIARMCGERGLEDEANQALLFAEEMVALHHSPREIQAFRRLTRVFGWERTVKWSEAGRTLWRCCRGQVVG